MSRSARLARIKRYREELIVEIGYLTIEETLALRRGRRYVAALLDPGLAAALPGRQAAQRSRVVDLEASWQELSPQCDRARRPDAASARPQVPSPP